MKLVFAQHKPTQVYHIGGQTLLKTGEANPYYDIDVNIKGMINILRCTKEHNASLIFTSTGAVYGLSDLPHRETSTPVPVCNYGVSKLAAELYLQKWVKTDNIDAKIVRFSSIYGQGRRAGPVNIFCRLAAEGKPITVFGTGWQTRDYVHVSDVCDGMIRVMERGLSGEVYNLGFGVESSVNDVVDLVAKHSPGVEVSHKPAPFSSYDLHRSWFDITKAQKLGYDPQIDLDKGVKRTLDEYLNGE